MPCGAATTGSVDDIRTLPAALRADLEAAFRFDTVDRHRGPRGRRRADREGAPSPRRRRADRIGADALPGPRRLARAAHAVHLEPGRLRRRLPVLRDRRARVRARPRDGRDRRPGPLRLAPAGRRRPAPDQRRVHGHGRAAAQPRPRAGGDLGAQRPAAVRPGRAAHHRVDLGRRARDPSPDRARAAVHAGGLAPRGARPVARRARAAQPALAGGRGRSPPRATTRPRPGGGSATRSR